MPLARYPLGHQRPRPHGRGYWEVKAPSHPLVDKDGWVARHRLVLYGHFNSPRGAPCELCRWWLPWRGGSWRYCVNVDHINGIPGDDRIENLRPLCGWCNANRNWAETFAPDEWHDTIRNQRPTQQLSSPPWDRPDFITLLSIEWGIGIADLFPLIEAHREANRP